MSPCWKDRNSYVYTFEWCLRSDIRLQIEGTARNRRVVFFTTDVYLAQEYSSKEGMKGHPDST